LDLMHAQAFLQVPVKVRAGVMEDVEGSEVVVVCASVTMPKNLTDRNMLVQGNSELMREILPKVAKAAPDCKILMVSNPVDALTWLALELTGFPRERVFGTGTLVDSIRFRELLSEELKIHADDLRAYILGEHGEKQFVAMSVAQAGGERIENTRERRLLCERAKGFGVEVFRKKGNTCYAIGLAAAYVVESILMNEHRTIPLSVRIDDFLGVKNVCLSLPVVIGSGGIEKILHPDLNDDESRRFRDAAQVVRGVIEQMA